MKRRFYRHRSRAAFRGLHRGIQDKTGVFNGKIAAGCLEVQFCRFQLQRRSIRRLEEGLLAGQGQFIVNLAASGKHVHLMNAAGPQQCGDQLRIHQLAAALKFPRRMVGGRQFGSDEGCSRRKVVKGKLGS